MPAAKKPATGPAHPVQSKEVSWTQVNLLLAFLAKWIQGMVEDRANAIEAAEAARAAQEAAQSGSGDVSPDDDTFRQRLKFISQCDLGTDSLVGSWFHKVEVYEGVVWQGCVVGEPQPGIYLVELLSWATGTSAFQRTVSVKTMTEEDWRFYDTEAQMQAAYEGVRNQQTEPQNSIT